MIGSQVYKFSGAFYIKAIVIGVVAWVLLNLLFGNSPLGGHYYIPFVLIIYLLVQLSYQVDVRKDAIHIKRFGMGGKVSYENLQKVSQESGTLALYASDGRQYNIPVSRFSKEDQKTLSEQLDQLWSEDPGEEVNVEEESESGIPDHMMKAEAKRWISQLLDSGMSKKEVFDQLKGRGVKDSKLAFMIASMPDEILCMLHEGKNNILVGIYAIMSALVIWSFYVSADSDLRLTVLFIQGTISALFIWGFFSFKLLAYNAYIFLGLISLPREAIATFSANDIPGMVGIAFAMAMIVYVWFVRSRLYPDAGLLGVKKDKSGKYQFSD